MMSKKILILLSLRDFHITIDHCCLVCYCKLSVVQVVTLLVKSQHIQYLVI